MRELATLADRQAAQVLVDYLLTQNIPGEVRIEGGQAEIWVRNEDDIERATAIWNEFKTQPNDSKYVTSRKTAQELRKLKEQAEKNYAKLYRDREHLWGRPHPFGVPVTMALIILSVIVTLWVEFGSNEQNLIAVTLMDKRALPFLQLNEINPDFANVQHKFWREQQLKSFKEGQYWRLITPIFIHFTWLHLLFNMYALYSLGGLIESRRGPIWTILFVVITGVVSNVMQFYFPTLFDLHAAKGHFLGSALFGGMSGVDFALFGYLVAKTLYSPEPGLRLPQDTILSMLIWLVICMTGMIGSIANTAHVAGLVMGFIIGVMPRVWKEIKSRR